VPCAAISSREIALVIAGVLALALAACLAGVVAAWFRSLVTKAGVGFWQLLFMAARRVPVDTVVGARITALKAGVSVPVASLEAHHLAGGSIVHAVKALITAEQAGLGADWAKIRTIDLAMRGSGKTVFDAVVAAVHPRVLACPGGAAAAGTTGGAATADAGSLTGIAKDGIQVKVRASVTVRASLARFVGGAAEETILARVGEGIVTAIGAAESYKAVMENPESISKQVLARRFDEGTAFDIVSIDITDAAVGANIAAQLQEAQAEAGKNMAQAQAESRRAAAVASEQEMKSKVQRMRAALLESEALVPQALAEALRAGRLGVVDYHRLENLKADTQMRLNLGFPEDEKIPKRR
jgi:uncharacterized protein YqfA (UPF0365 family)